MKTAIRRKDDPPAGRTRYRTERVVEDRGSWYFLTREGSVEGPFECRADALEQLDVYKKLIDMGLLPTGGEVALEY